MNDATGLVEPTTLEEIARDFVPCGMGTLRRKDASNAKPSCLLGAKDVLRIGLAQAEREYVDERELMESVEDAR